MYKIIPEKSNQIRRVIQIEVSDKKIKKMVNVVINYNKGYGFSENLPEPGCSTIECVKLGDDIHTAENIVSCSFDYALTDWADDYDKLAFQDEFVLINNFKSIPLNWTIIYDSFFIDTPFIVDMINGNTEIKIPVIPS